MKSKNIVASPLSPTRSRRLVLGTCSATHFIHDGFSDLLYLLLPVWQVELGLSLTQVGVIRSLYSGALASTQIPIGFLSERLGERRLLALGTALTGGAYFALGMAESLTTLVMFLLIAGTGSGTQHPLCSSLVAKAYEGGSQRVALGFYNFAGDIGKMLVPLLAALVITQLNWQSSTIGYGTVGILAAVLILYLLAKVGVGAPPSIQESLKPPSYRDWGICNPSGFRILAVIGVLDSASRTAFLTFLPFLFIGKGASVEIIGLALALVFGGGAAGKFICGLIAERFGIARTVMLTELITCAGIILIIPSSIVAALALLPLVGLGLNGTSSALYGSVAEFVAPERRSRGFSLFYTLSIGAGAASPILFGILGDQLGVVVTLSLIAGMVSSIIPLAILLGGNSSPNATA
jgi:FSR family fosmidomycin resistance protein-like MFS transporter